MSIKPINKIPMTVKEGRESYRARIRADIEEALSKRIEYFEFEGDYNYKYLAQYAREEADRIIRHITHKHESKITNILKEEFNEEYIYVPWLRDSDRIIKAHNHKGEDRNHVYMSIDYDRLDNLYDTLMKATRDSYARKVKNNERGV